MKSPILQPVYLGRVITLGVCLENVKKDNKYKNTRLLSGIKQTMRPLVATFFWTMYHFSWLLEQESICSFQELFV